MGLRSGTVARVWSCNDMGKYCQCAITISKKNKETQVYETEFQDGFVRFIGRANEAIKQVGLPTSEERKAGNTTSKAVRILDCDVTNFYTSPDGKTSYTPHYVVFDIELPDANGNFASFGQGGNASAPRAQGGQRSGVGYNPSRPTNDIIDIPEDVDEELPFK